MRYISKPQNSEARILLDDARRTLRALGLTESYDNFNEYAQLNNILRREQKSICCYCQKKITHHNTPNEGGSHNEHFYPERGANARPDLQLDYENLYACCNTTKDSEEALKHCGWSKHESLIPTNFLRDPSCSSFFLYNTDGEITPTGPYRRYEDFKRNENKLTTHQQEILNAIDILNLNINSLKEFRRKVIADVHKSMLNCTKQQLQHRILTLDNPASGEYAPMIDLVLFFIKKRIASMP